MPHARSTSWSLALAGAAALSLGASTAAPARAAEAAARGLDFEAVARAERLIEVGHGALRFLTLPMYRATLWSGDGRYRGASAQPLALTLLYQHGFSRAQLIDITVGEWRRLGLADGPTRERWAAALGALLGDVEVGDERSVLVTPAAGTSFYRAGRLIGRIADPAFGPAYLAIWLDERSRVGRLRSELLGPLKDAAP